MKDKLVELSSPLSLPVHPHLVYPAQHSLAGEPLRAVGTVRGRPVWPVMGGAPEDDNPEGGAGKGEGDDKGDTGGAGGDKSDADKGGDKGDKGDPQAKIDALLEEKDRHYRKRQEAEQELEDLRKYKKDKEAENQTETERLTTERDEAVKERDTLSTQVQDLQLEIAFLSDNTYKWQNPKRALQLADLSEVEIKDGKVTGLDKALKKLAESDPYLVKKDEEEGTGAGPTGRQHNGRKKTNDQPDKNVLRSKYPALRGR